MKLFNGENEEAKEIFLSSLEIDPNFFLANVDINESDVKLKQIYNQKAAKNIGGVNNYEKLYYEYTSTNNRFKKRGIAKKIKDNYPNNYEGYILEGLTHYWWSINTEKAQENFKEAIKLDPDNIIACLNYVDYRYNGASKAFVLRSDNDFYKKFDKDASELIEKFPNNITVLSRMGLIYRNSITEDDNSRFDKSKDIYEKAIEIAKKNNSSRKFNLTLDLADLYIMSGKYGEGLEILNNAVNISEGTQKIVSNFTLFNSYIFMNDYLNAVKAIDRFIDSIQVDQSITEEQKLKCMVGTNYMKTVIYAHADQKKRAQLSLNDYKISSDKLIEFFGWKRDSVNSNLSRLGIQNLGERIRWTQFTPYWQLRNEAWTDILIGNYQKASKLLDELEKKYNQNRNDLRGVLDIMQGNLEQGISKLDKIGTGKYPLYFKAQALRSLGKTENAIQLLDSIRFLPIQNINNSLIVKRSNDLYKELIN